MDWHNIHKKHLKTFVEHVVEAKKAKGIRAGPNSNVAFNNYLCWFLPRTRVQLLPNAYTEDLLEEPLSFDKLGTVAYNKLVREGCQVTKKN
jgi:hypothetical protein